MRVKSFQRFRNLIELFTNASLTTAIGVPFILKLHCDLFDRRASCICNSIYSHAGIFRKHIFLFKVNNISDAAKSSLDKLSVFVEALNNLETLKSIATTLTSKNSSKNQIFPKEITVKN